MSSLKIYYFQVLFISLIVVNHLFEIYLNRRQINEFLLNRSKLPEAFSGHLTLNDHQRSIEYSSAKLNFSVAHLIFDATLLFYWFPFRGAEKLYLALPFHDINKEVLFLMCFFLIQFLLGLPWSIYSTFHLEEKFGFNRSNTKLFILDRLKGLALGALIGTPLLYLIIFIFYQVGQWWWLISFITLTLFQFFLLWIYPTFIAPLFNKFSPLETGDLKSDIEKLVANAGFSPNGIFIMDASRRSSHGNAYFTGFGKNKRVVFFDTLLKGLGHNEILAILAHELGHLKLKHIPKSLALSIFFSFLSFALMGYLANENWFYSGHFVRVMSPAVLFLLFSSVLPLYTFWASPLMSWLSRKREFEADAYAAKETQSQFLINGLLKLYQQNSSPVITDSLYSLFYHTHPPASERIKRLESLER